MMMSFSQVALVAAVWSVDIAVAPTINDIRLREQGMFKVLMIPVLNAAAVVFVETGLVPILRVTGSSALNYCYTMCVLSPCILCTVFVGNILVFNQSRERWHELFDIMHILS